MELSKVTSVTIKVRYVGLVISFSIKLFLTQDLILFTIKSTGLSRYNISPSVKINSEVLVKGTYENTIFKLYFEFFLSY